MVLTIVSKEGLVEIYNQIAEIIGLDNTEKLYEYLKGQQITFPMRLYKTEYIVEIVKKKYNGKNLKELAREVGYSERYLRSLLEKQSKLDDT